MLGLSSSVPVQGCVHHKEESTTHSPRFVYSLQLPRGGDFLDGKGKNTLNTTKGNTTPTKTSGPTTARLEHPNIDEGEETDLKNDFRRMFEALKEKMKNSLQEMKEKTNKKLEEINKSLKENKEKAFKQMKETIQDLKIEIEATKKAQTMG